MNLIATSTITTMSTREVAELIEKLHSNIKISAERLAASGVIGTLAPQEFIHNGNTYTEYLLCKRDSLILVAQNCPEFTARIVDRWQELEEQQAKPDPMRMLSDPAMLRAALLGYTEKVIELEGVVAAQAVVVAEQAPKVEALNRIATSDGLMCITDAAKNLQIQPKRLFGWMQQHQWIYRRAGGSGFVGYQNRIQSGCLSHKVVTIDRSDGSTATKEQVLVTAKGLTKLAESIGLH